MRALKKILLWIVLVAVFTALLIGGVFGYAYYSTDAGAFTPPEVRAGGTALPLNGYTWNEPVMGGILYKKSDAPAKALSLPDLCENEWQQADIVFELPELPVHLVMQDASGKTVLDVNNETQVSFTFPANGTYTVRADVTFPKHLASDRPGAPAHGYGSFGYAARLCVNAPPELTFSSTKVLQGDVVAVRLSGILDDPAPVIETDLGMAVFCDVPGGKAALIGIHYNREPGKWPVHIRCGSLDVTQEITVVHRDYPKRALPAQSEPSGAAEQEEWRSAIFPLYASAQPQFYWKGRFIRPCDTETQAVDYGAFLYKDGSGHPSRSAGIDYACAPGETVYAPARGVVEFAGPLRLTGNTVVVSHGGGLKSYFYYLDALSCKKGDTLEQKQPIGTAGAQPHFHYEARIGNQSVDPDMLFSGKSGLYAAQ